MRLGASTIVALVCSACGDHATAMTPVDAAPAVCRPAFCGTYDAPLRCLVGDALEICGCAPGDAVLVAVGCDSTSAPTTVAITSSPGWDFTPLSPVTGSTSAGRWIASFGAVAPDVVGQLAVTWGGASCTRSWLVADDLPNADPTGGITTFDAHAQAAGGSMGALTIAIGNANDAIWAAGVSSNDLFYKDGSTPIVYSPGQACDQDNDLITTGVRTTTDPAGTLKTINVLNSGGTFAVTAVSIKHR